MAKNIKKNYIFNVTYQILSLIIPLVTIPYLARILQPEAVGILSYSESIVSYFSLFAVLGTTIYAQREIGKVQDSPEARSKVFWEIQIVRTISGLIAIAAYIVYVFVVNTNFVVCMVLTLEIFNTIVDITWFYQGLEDFRFTVICGLIGRILGLVFIFVFVKSPDDLWLYALSKGGISVLVNLIMWALLPKYLRKVRGVKPFKHIKTIVSFFIPAIATQVYMILDKSMIGWMTSTRVENGYYEYADKIIRISIVVISSLAAVLIPRVSKAYADGDNETVKNIVYQAIRYVWLIGIPIMAGFLAVADVFVPVYLGEGFEKSAELMKIFAPIVVIVGMANIIGLSFLIPINKQNVYLVSVVVAAVINLGLNFLLIPKLYSVGAAIASVAAEFISICIQFGYIFKKKLLSAKNVFLPSIKYLIAALIMFAAVYAVKTFLPVNVWALLALIAIGIVVYFTFVFILRDSFTIEFTKKVFAKIRSTLVGRAAKTSAPADGESVQDGNSEGGVSGGENGEEGKKDKEE